MHRIEVERAQPFVDAVDRAFPGRWHALDDVDATPAVKALIAAPSAVRRTALLLLADRVERAEAGGDGDRGAYLGDAMRALMRWKLPLTADDAVRLNRAHASGGGYSQACRDAAAVDPLPLDQVPPLVLSEIFRDVDLFVAVASVGNDPTWQDGGPGHRHREYWQSYSFGELAESAKTRRAVLETIVPRLKIRDRATLDGRFLVVRGNLRTYRIHLGSGNILMEPDDQYLCIVRDQSARAATAAAGDPGLFLPFEGDDTLAMILSKAFLLAADDRIADPIITRQINGR